MCASVMTINNNTTKQKRIASISWIPLQIPFSHTQKQQHQQSPISLVEVDYMNYTISFHSTKAKLQKIWLKKIEIL